MVRYIFYEWIAKERNFICCKNNYVVFNLSAFTKKIAENISIIPIVW